ncbi:MAG: hypothetical protein HOC79_05695 [Euryarchaeota archaeon]|jgi:hypothetical protein|nr:hypothetical protein [Euryarchaeota archaeon]
MNEGKCDNNHPSYNPSYIDPVIIEINKLKAKLLEAQCIIGDLLSASQGVYETGDQCVEISLHSLNNARDYLKLCGIDYYYEAEGWEIHYQEMLYDEHQEEHIDGSIEGCSYCLEDIAAQAEQEQDAQDSKKEAL